MSATKNVTVTTESTEFGCWQRWRLSSTYYVTDPLFGQQNN
jgi:hypothetical protein